jgi:zinc transporter
MSSMVDPAVLYAVVLDGKGSGRRLESWDAIHAWKPSDGVLWMNVDYYAPEVVGWLAEHSKIDPLMREALTDQDPRPRAAVHSGDDLLCVVRGINVNKGAEPEDMISIRMYIERERVVMLRHRTSRSLKQIAADLERGRGPKDSADIVVHLIDHVVDGVSTRIDALGDAVAALEHDALMETRPGNLRAQIADHRRRAIALRRFLGPQREALVKLAAIGPAWFTQTHREAIAEVADRMARSVEELDAARDRAAVTQEELSSRLAELTNQRLYVLAMITAIFLPLGFVCSLLGVNVGGVPFQKDEWAFWVLIALFATVVALQLFWFRKRGWF